MVTVQNTATSARLIFAEIVNMANLPNDQEIDEVIARAEQLVRETADAHDQALTAMIRVKLYKDFKALFFPEK